MPVASDLPMIDCAIVEVPNPAHPYGVRGVGEVGIVPPMAAVGNAINDAIDVDDDDGFNSAAARLFRTQDYPPQFRSLSPYFDKKLFSYDERTITAIDRLQPHVDFGIKFINVRRGTRRRVSFKLMVSNSMANNARSKRRVQYVFHPSQIGRASCRERV